MYGSNKCVISFITIIFFSSITYMHRTEWCNIKVTPLQHVNNCQNQEFIYYVAIATVNEKIIKTRTMDIYTSITLNRISIIHVSLKETGRETPGAISLWPKQIYIILTIFSHICLKDTIIKMPISQKLHGVGK